MNNAQYADWLRHHLAAFPTLKGWLETRTDTVIAWLRCLADVSLEHANAASDAMLRGEMGSDLFFDKHPMLIHTFAKSQRDAASNGKTNQDRWNSRAYQILAQGRERGVDMERIREVTRLEHAKFEIENDCVVNL